MTQDMPSLKELRAEWDRKIDDPYFEESFIEYRQARIAESQAQPKDTALQRDWRSRKGWESADIHSEVKSGLKIIWGIAALMFGISLALLFVIPDEWANGNHAIAITLIFPAAAAYVLYLATTKTIEYQHFGKVIFAMDPYPGAIGGNVGGQVFISRRDQLDASVRLECIYTYISTGGKDSSRKKNIKWAQEGTPKIDSTASGLKLSFRFDIPEGLPPADADQSDAYHFWRLTVKGKRPGIDLERQYNIPVFQTSEQSRYVHHDITAQAAKLKETQSKAIREAITTGNFDIPELSHVMRVTDVHGELRLTFPMFRNKFLTIFSGMFAAGFGVASYAILTALLESGFLGVLLGGLFLSPFILIAIFATIVAIYLPFNNLRITIKGSQINVLRRLLLIPIYYREFSRIDIDHLFIRRSGSTGQGVDKIKHYKVQAKLKNGGKVTLAEDINGEDTAGHLKSFLARRLNVPGAVSQS